MCLDEKGKQGAAKSFPEMNCVLVGACSFCAHLSYSARWWRGKGDSFHVVQCKMNADSFVLLPYVISQPSVHVNSLIWDFNVLN